MLTLHTPAPSLWVFRSRPPEFVSPTQTAMASILSKKQKKSEKYSLSDLKTLGHQLLSSRTHINNLPLLLTFINPSSPPQCALESLLSLQSFFTPLLPELPRSSSKPSLGSSHTDPEFIYQTWVRSKFDDLVQSLIAIAISSQSEEHLREVVLDAIMDFVKVANGGRFHSAIYHKFIHSIVYSTSGVDILLDLLASKYFKYIDVRYGYITHDEWLKILFHYVLNILHTQAHRAPKKEVAGSPKAAERWQAWGSKTFLC